MVESSMDISPLINLFEFELSQFSSRKQHSLTEIQLWNGGVGGA